MSQARSRLSHRGAARIILITLLLLSGFMAKKSYVAVYNVKQWSDDISRFFIAMQAQTAGRAVSTEAYFTRLDSIQKQWTVVRHVSIAACVLCCVGIVLLSLSENAGATHRAIGSSHPP